MKPLKRPRNGPKNGSVSSANQEVPDINELSAPICTFCFLGHKDKGKKCFISTPTGPLCSSQA